MKLPRRKFLHLAAGRCGGPDRVAHRLGASLFRLGPVRHHLAIRNGRVQTIWLHA